MNTMQYSAVTIVLAAWLAGCTAPAGGDWPRQGVVSPFDAPGSATVTATNDLALQLASDKTRYLVGEPVYVSVTLRNTGREAQRVIANLQPEAGAVAFFVGTSAEDRRHFAPLAEADHDAGVFAQLAPGATIGAVVPIFFGGGGWTFVRPGRYSVAATYQLPAGKGSLLEARSKPLMLEIEASAEGSRLIGDGGATAVEIGKFLTWQRGDHLERGRGQLLALIQGTPASALASYANFAFARSWGEDFMNYRKREVRPADCERAMQHLAQARTTDVTDYVRLQGEITAARCLARLGKVEEARKRFAATTTITRDRPEYAALAARVSEFAGHLASKEQS